MTTGADPIARLAALCDSGDLRFVYVLGVARSNSTVVCKILGDRLDGAVYEPATPVAVHLQNHYARTILHAYDVARAGKGDGGPVVFAIKDLSLFVRDGTLDFILKYADHVVFTVRDPLTQYPSLVAQLKTEFGLRNRVDAMMRWPVETCLFGYYTMVLGSGYFADAVRTLGYAPSKSLLLPIAGWNLANWRSIVRQFDAIRARFGAARVTVLDAGLMRFLPEVATAELDAIAGDLRSGVLLTETPVELAAHSRMFRGSAWAGEARHSDAIKPLSVTATSRRPKDAFEKKMLAAVYPDYGHLFFDPANRMLAEARADETRPGVLQFGHLLGADGADESLARLLGTDGPPAERWEAEHRAAH